MRIALNQHTVADVTKGFGFNELEGRVVFGRNGLMVMRTESQRPYEYGDGKRDVAVIDILFKGYPLGCFASPPRERPRSLSWRCWTGSSASPVSGALWQACSRSFAMARSRRSLRCPRVTAS